MTSKEDLKDLKDAFLTIKQEWLEDSNVKLTEWQKNIFESLEKDLERLEQIDNAKPSEALECLENLEKEKEFDVVSQNFDYHYLMSKDQVDIIKQALIKAQEQDKILELLKKCYYASSIDETLYKTSYGFDNPQDVRKIMEGLDEKEIN